MLVQHENEMMGMLDDVYDKGSAQVTTWKLKRWFEQKKMSKNMFRTLDDKFNSISENTPMFIGDLNGTYVFIYALGLTAEKVSFFKPVKEWLDTW